MFAKARDVSIASRLWLVAHELCPPFANQVVVQGHGRFDTKRSGQSNSLRKPTPVATWFYEAIWE